MWVLYLEIACGALLFVGTVIWTLKGSQLNRQNLETKKSLSSGNDNESS